MRFAICFWLFIFKKKVCKQINSGIAHRTAEQSVRHFQESLMSNKNDFSEFIIKNADDEFHGKAFNLHSLIETLRQLNEVSASDTNTFEGYCAWEIANHVCYAKIMILQSLNNLHGNSEDSGYMLGIKPIPFEFKDFAPIPENISVDSWSKFLNYFEKVHENCMNAIKDMSAEMFSMIMPEWKIPYGEIIAWLFTHDTYHNAQIRNMGISQLKEKKVPYHFDQAE
jgi:hypothetical protein